MNGTIVRLTPLQEARRTALGSIRAARRRLRVGQAVCLVTALLAGLMFLSAPTVAGAIGVSLVQAACGWLLWTGHRTVRQLDRAEREARGPTRIGPR